MNKLTGFLSIVVIVITITLTACGGGGSDTPDGSTGGGDNAGPPVTPGGGAGGGNTEPAEIDDILGRWESNCMDSMRVKIEGSPDEISFAEIDDTLTFQETISYDIDGNFFQRSVGYMDPSCLVESGLIIEMSGQYALGNEVVPQSGMNAVEIDEKPYELRLIGRNSGVNALISHNSFTIQLNLVRREFDELFFGESLNAFVRPTELDFVNTYQLAN